MSNMLHRLGKNVHMLSSARVVRSSPCVSFYVRQCVRILSSVVPNDLSFELNQCLRNGVLSLQKGHELACTEPFRIPLAGKVRGLVASMFGSCLSSEFCSQDCCRARSLEWYQVFVSSSGIASRISFDRIA